MHAPALRPVQEVDTPMGVIAGIARHARPRGPMEVIGCAEISLEGGIAGDWRGVRKPGGRGRRQVTLLEREDWAAALAEVGADIPWFERRSNLLIDGFDLPQVPGTLLRLGADVVLEVTCETNPCHRMDALVPGLFAAMMADWRGGVCARVLEAGSITVGDPIRLEER